MEIISLGFNSLADADKGELLSFGKSLLEEIIDSGRPNHFITPLLRIVDNVLKVAIHNEPESCMEAWRVNHCTMCLEPYQFNTDHFGYVLACGHVMCSRAFGSSHNCFMCRAQPVQSKLLFILHKLYPYHQI
jgi:hypothetical protein